MKLDTATVRRLRDALIAQAGPSPERFGPRASEEPPGPHGEAPSRDDLTPEELAAIDRVGPMVETMYLMMVADKDDADVEQHAIRGAIEMLTAGVLGRAAIDHMLGAFAETVEEQGALARLQQLGALLAGDRDDAEGAFALAAAVAMADDAVAAEEDRLVEAIAEWYGISPRRVAAILEEVS